MTVTNAQDNLDSLSYDEIFDILDAYEEADDAAPEHPVVTRVAERVQHYSTLAGEALKEGRDYMPLLTPGAETPAIEAAAMEIVLEILEDELESSE